MRMGRCTVTANLACALHTHGRLTLMQSSTDATQFKVTWQPGWGDDDDATTSTSPLDMFGGGNKSTRHSSSVEMRFEASRVVFENEGPDGRVVAVVVGRRRELFWVQQHGKTHVAEVLEHAVQQAVADGVQSNGDRASKGASVHMMDDKQAADHTGVRIGPLPSSLLRAFLDAAAQARGGAGGGRVAREEGQPGGVGDAEGEVVADEAVRKSE